ncbi:hypothetical protein D920_02596 [Enterococcus faecalis 13-SD-W-01]|nr:hypothetical protein D920_02596 [Enterococcus faecalis 13-SD-W-01]
MFYELLLFMKNLINFQKIDITNKENYSKIKSVFLLFGSAFLKSCASVEKNLFLPLNNKKSRHGCFSGVLLC